MKSLKWFQIFTLLIVVSLVLAACAPQVSQPIATPPAAEEAAPTEAPAAAPAATEVPAAAPAATEVQPNLLHQPRLSSVWTRITAPLTRPGPTR